MTPSIKNRLMTTLTGRSRLVVLAALGGIAIATPAIAEDVSALATRLTKLRVEVESLAASLSAKHTETADRLRSLARQKSDLEIEVQREQGRVQKINQRISKRREEITAEKEKGNKMVPLFKSSAEEIKGYISESLPFRTEERISAVEKIEEQYKAGLLNPASALMRLWSLMEDEFRMTRENGLFRQSIIVDGKEQLADVIRVGMVMLYYQVSETEVGRAVKTDGGWAFQPFSSQQDMQLVNGLFSSFKKQIRVGYFELPNGLTDPVEVSK